MHGKARHVIGKARQGIGIGNSKLRHRQGISISKGRHRQGREKHWQGIGTAKHRQVKA
jgi:hypothetical protein